MGYGEDIDVQTGSLRWVPTFANSLHCADLCIVFHCMKGEVDLRTGLLLIDCADRIVDLLVTALLDGILPSFDIHGELLVRLLKD